MLTSCATMLKANVLASMKQVSYETVVTLSVNSGFVLAASCQCKASALGRCRHVGAFCWPLMILCRRWVMKLLARQRHVSGILGKKGKNPQKTTEAGYNANKSGS